MHVLELYTKEENIPDIISPGYVSVAKKGLQIVFLLSVNIFCIINSDIFIIHFLNRFKFRVYYKNNS